MYCNTPQNATPPGVEVISAVSCTLSVFGAIMIFMTYILISEIRNTTRKLVIWLTVADLVTPLGYLASFIYNESDNVTEYTNTTLFCKTQSAVTTYSSLVSFFLTICIAFHLLLAVFRPQNSPRRFILPIANIISWGVPGIIICVALMENMLGREANDSPTVGTGSWCWVKCKESNPHKTLFYMYLTGKGFEILCYVITAALYVLMKLRMYLVYRNRRLHDIQSDLRDDDKNFVYVWLVFLMIRIWGTIRFYLRVIPDKTSDVIEGVDRVLIYFQAIGDPSQAFCNCILFCILDGEIWKKILGYILCRPSHAHNNNMVDIEDTDNDVDINRDSDCIPLFGQNYSGRRRYGSCSELVEETTNQHKDCFERMHKTTG
ncbi:GP157-like protein [Mya arenaria]|uniref:GP157-like protein n=2 Tax=Mya arenaria TaxID=6604 RepID=A0ABY7F348_MYAAR|nr:GP157-like protein [Mya arenaria]